MATVSTEIVLSESLITWSKAPDPRTNESIVPRGRYCAYTQNYGQSVTGAGAGDQDRFYGAVSLPENYVYRLKTGLVTVQHSSATTARQVYRPTLRMVGITGPRDQGTATLVSGNAQQTVMTDRHGDANNYAVCSFTNLPAAGYLHEFEASEQATSLFLREFQSSSSGTTTTFPAGIGFDTLNSTANPGGTWYVQAYFDFLIYDINQAFEQELNTILFTK